MIKIKQPILFANMINKNGRIYTTEILESAARQINEKNPSLNIGEFGYSDSIESYMRKAAFTYSNAVVENDVLYVDIHPLKTDKGDELVRYIKEDLINEFVFRSKGAGSLNENEKGNTTISDDYKILGLSMISREDDAFNMDELPNDHG